MLPEEHYEDIVEKVAATPGLTVNGLLEHVASKAVPAQTFTGWLGDTEIRTMQFTELGCTVEGHAHHYDHVTIICKGKLCLSTADQPATVDCPFHTGDDCNYCQGKGKVVEPVRWSQERLYGPGNVLFIPAFRLHKFVCVEMPDEGNGLAFCVRACHRLREDGPVMKRNEYMPDYG